MGFKNRFYILMRLVTLILGVFFSSLNSYGIAEYDYSLAPKPAAEKSLECRILFPQPHLQSALKEESPSAKLPIQPTAPPTHLVEQMKGNALSAPPVINVAEVLTALNSNLLNSTGYVDQLFQMKTSQLQAYIQRLSLQYTQKSTQGLDLHAFDSKVHGIQNNLNELTQIVEYSNPGVFSGLKPQAHSIEKQFLSLQKSFQESSKDLTELQNLYQIQLNEYESLLLHEVAMQEHLGALHQLHSELVRRSSDFHQSNNLSSENNLNIFFIEPLTSLTSQAVFQKTLLDSKIIQMYQELQMTQSTMRAMKEFITIHWPNFLDQHQEKLQKVLPKTLSKGNWEKLRNYVKEVTKKTLSLPKKIITADNIGALLATSFFIAVFYTPYYFYHNHSISEFYTNFYQKNSYADLEVRAAFDNTKKLDLNLEKFYDTETPSSEIYSPKKIQSFTDLMSWLQDETLSINTSRFILDNLQYFNGVDLDSKNAFSNKSHSPYPAILNLIITTLEHTDESLSKDAPLEMIQSWAQSFETNSYQLIDKNVQDKKISHKQAEDIKQKIHTELQRIVTPKKSFMGVSPKIL